MQPTCPTCMSTLRWFPDHQQWGCDTCRVMIPPPMQSVVAPRRSRRMLWIAAGVGVGVVAGVVALVVAGGSKSGVAGSVDEAVKRTFAAMSRGDTDALVAGAGISTMKKYAECTDVDETVDKREQDDLEREMARLARRENGATFEVVSIDDSKTPKTVHKGDAMGMHCKATADLVPHEVAIALRVTRAGTTYDQPATSTVIEVDGKFLVVNAPKMPGCSAAIARVRLLEERNHGTRNLDVDACIKDHWSSATIDCLTHALSMTDVDACKR